MADDTSCCGGRHGRKIALHSAAVLRAAFLNQGFGLRFCRLIIEYNLRARSHKQTHRRRADAARSAGDQGDFSLERQIHNA